MCLKLELSMITYVHRGKELDNWYRIATLCNLDQNEKSTHAHFNTYEELMLTKVKVEELKKDIILKDEKIHRLLGIIRKYEDSKSN